MTAPRTRRRTIMAETAVIVRGLAIPQMRERRRIWSVIYCFTTGRNSKEIYNLQYMAYSAEKTLPVVAWLDENLLLL